MVAISAGDSRSYNDLLPIAAAQRAFKERGGEVAVDKLLSIIAEAGAESTVGVRLLHKHNDLDPSEIMYETGTVDEKGFALVTSAVSRGDVRSGPVCNSWCLTGSEFTAVEFSEAHIIAPESDVTRHENLFHRLADAIVDLKVAAILGPCLNYSSYVEGFAPSPDAAFLEKTDFKNRANVVRYVLRSDAEFSNSAKTKWRAKRITDQIGRATWMTACNCFCSVFPDGSGHQGTTTHTYEPDRKDR